MPPAPADEQEVTDAQWRVMERLWAEAPQGAAALAAALGEAEGWSVSTVKTLLARLVERGAVAAEPETPGSNRFAYRPRVTRERCRRARSRGLVERVFGGDGGALAAHLIRSEPLTAEQIEELRALLEAKKPAKKKTRKKKP